MKRTTRRPFLKADRDVTLCEVLDRVLNKGAVIHGDLTIPVADIDLLDLGLRLIVTSIETAIREGAQLPRREYDATR